MSPSDGDTMACRACGIDGRASEGYPCAGCGTFVCIVCEIRGVTRCRACQVALNKPSLIPHQA